jgi:N-acetyl-alpha-D-glucosaminyl L-malate synthase BshA
VRIGITCYPTFGGSGVVATELGIALAKHGDDVHFISYAMPSRLNVLHERVHFHEVNVTPYPLFDPYPPYTLALATKMAEVAAYEKLDILHVHYAIPHAISAYLAKQILRSTIKVITTLHGTDITLVGRDESYLPITKFGIEESDGVTAVSQWLKKETARNFHTDKAIEVVPNFVDPARFRRAGSEFCNTFSAPRKTGLPRLELPPRQARHGRRGDVQAHRRGGAQPPADDRRRPGAFTRGSLRPHA